jgi:hypothetical protein
MSYGPRQTDSYREAGNYTSRVLKMRSRRNCRCSYRPRSISRSIFRRQSTRPNDSADHAPLATEVIE